MPARRAPALPFAAPAPSMLDTSEAHYREQAAELCERAGITEDDLRMRLEAAKHQGLRIRVYREVEREGWQREPRRP